jgi:hypothetical protein
MNGDRLEEEDARAPADVLASFRQIREHQQAVPLSGAAVQ